MTKEKKKKNYIANKIAPKRPRDHDDPAAIQVFEARIHYLTLILFYLYVSITVRQQLILFCLCAHTEQE